MKNRSRFVQQSKCFLYIEQSTVWFDNLVQCPMPICEEYRPDRSPLASIWIYFWHTPFKKITVHINMY